MLRALMLTALGLLLMAAPARAQDDIPPRARFERAVGHYEAGRYREALADFRRLYEITEEPGLLYNIARCHEELGELEPAITALEGYLDAVPSGPDREDALTRLVSLERRRRTEGAAPRPGEGELREAEPGPGPEGAPDAASGLSTLGTVGVALLAVGGAGLLTGAILGGVTAAEHGRLQDTCAPRCRDEELSDLRAFGAGADVSLIGGGVIAALGLVLLVVGLMDEDDDAAAVRLRGLGLELALR